MSVTLNFAGEPLRNPVEHASEYSPHRIRRPGIHLPSPVPTGGGFSSGTLTPFHFWATEKTLRAPVKSSGEFQITGGKKSWHPGNCPSQPQVNSINNTPVAFTAHLNLGLSLPNPCLTDVTLTKICPCCKTLFFSTSSTPFLMNSFQTQWPKLQCFRMPQNKH